MKTVWLLAWKDLVVEARTRELVSSMSLVAFLAVVILGLAVVSGTVLLVRARRRRTTGGGPPGQSPSNGTPP